MNILAFETATETMVVAAARQEFWACYQTSNGLKHAAQLAPHIRRITSDLDFSVKDVSLIGVGIGPGSFTGVRIGIATAKGLAAVTGARIVGISGLDILAHAQRHFNGIVVPVIDARKNRFYSACYREGDRISDYFDKSHDDLSTTINAFAPDGEPVLLTGPANNQFFAKTHSLPWQLDHDVLSVNPLSLIELTKLAAHNKPSEISPLYLRQSEAELGISPKPVQKQTNH